MPFWGFGWLSTKGGRGASRPSSNEARSGAAESKSKDSDLTKHLRKRLLGVKGARVNRRSVSPSSSRRHAEQQRKLGKRILITSIEEDPEPAVAPKYVKSEAGSDANLSEDSDDGDVGVEERREAEAETIIEAGPHLNREDPANADWTATEADLFDLLQDCGAEPMLPMSWKLDFPVLPDACFTTRDDQVVIGAQKGSDYHGSRAMKDLFKVGPRVRDRARRGASPTRILCQAINRYIKWTMTDGGLTEKQERPILCVRGADGDNVAKGVDEINKAMIRMRDRYREEPTGPRPVVFGIIVVETIMTFLGLDTTKDATEAKAIAVYDWSQEGQDAWSAMAVAILAMMTRATVQDMAVEVKREEAEGA